MLRSVLTPRDILLASLMLLGCASGSDVADSKSCSTDADCSSGQKCHVTEVPGQRPMVVAPPCLNYQICTSSDSCGDGNVCAPASQLQGGFSACPSSVCMPACPTRACRADETCSASGQCELTLCDQPSATPCADHWHCDPTTAMTTPVTGVLGASDTDDPARAAQRGCVRTPCNEPDGYVCLADWECATERATDNSGCAAIPCDELGHCSSDDYYICHATSSAPRPEAKDPFGCVQRNCEEGYPCMYNYNGQNFAYCDAGSPEADDYGCRIHDCTEMPSACTSGSFRCEPGATNADRLGCVPVLCTEGYECPEGLTCDPSSALRNQFGCAAIVSGTGGTGGSSGSGGAGTGGIAAGGSSGSSGSSGTAGVVSTGGTGAVGGTNGQGGSSGSPSGGTSGTGGSGALGGTSGSAGSGGRAGGMCVAE